MKFRAIIRTMNDIISLPFLLFYSTQSLIRVKLVKFALITLDIGHVIETDGTNIVLNIGSSRIRFQGARTLD